MSATLLDELPAVIVPFLVGNFHPEAIILNRPLNKMVSSKTKLVCSLTRSHNRRKLVSKFIAWAPAHSSVGSAQPDSAVGAAPKVYGLALSRDLARAGTVAKILNTMENILRFAWFVETLFCAVEDLNVVFMSAVDM